MPPCLTAGRLSPLQLDRAMSHIHIHAAGLTRRQIATAPVDGFWARLVARLRTALGR